MNILITNFNTMNIELTPDQIKQIGEKYCTDRIEEPIDTEWKPEMNKIYYNIGWEGNVNNDMWFNDEEDKKALAFGNIYKTKEDAEQAKLRQESLSKGFIPERGEDFWIWDFDEDQPYSSYDTKCWTLDPKFRTEAEAQDWGDKYKEAWLYNFK